MLKAIFKQYFLFYNYIFTSHYIFLSAITNFTNNLTDNYTINKIIYSSITERANHYEPKNKHYCTCV